MSPFHYPYELPKQALIVGGGYIAIEFACKLHNLGVDVTLSYRGEMFLRGFDNDVRHHLKDQLLSKGLKLAFNHQVVAIEKR
ncbi:MAG: NAD-binding protein, partial [Pseudomonadales bacterium]|nr:NAD-binding protein [Pseudomonadales bacterium]